MESRGCGQEGFTVVPAYSGCFCVENMSVSILVRDQQVEATK